MSSISVASLGTERSPKSSDGVQLAGEVEVGLKWQYLWLRSH